MTPRRVRSRFVPQPGGLRRRPAVVAPPAGVPDAVIVGARTGGGPGRRQARTFLSGRFVRALRRKPRPGDDEAFRAPALVVRSGIR